MSEQAATIPETPVDPGLTVLLADDHRIVRDGLRLILETQLDANIVGEAGDVEAAERGVREHHPALLLLDLNMPGGPSLELIPKLTERFPGTRVVVVTMQNDAAFADQALAAGARGYVLKDSGSAELIDAIRLVLAGDTFVSPALRPV